MSKADASESADLQLTSSDDGVHDPGDHLRVKIERAINECSAENGSNTPDFILAQFLIDCLLAFDAAVQAREQWYDHKSEVAHP